MRIIERVKNIILQPKEEWNRISEETPDVRAIVLNYVLPLSIIPAIATFLGWGLIGRTYKVWGGLATTVKGWGYGLSQSVVVFISAILAVFVAALVIDLLAQSFKSEKNFGRSFQLVAFAWTPAWIAGIFNLIPAISFLGTLFGIYSLVLLYFGIGIMKKTPEESKAGYFVVSLLVMVVAFMIVSLIIGAIVGAIWVGKSGMAGASYQF
jgi:hypothetical protein